MRHKRTSLTFSSGNSVPQRHLNSLSEKFPFPREEEQFLARRSRFANFSIQSPNPHSSEEPKSVSQGDTLPDLLGKVPPGLRHSQRPTQLVYRFTGRSSSDFNGPGLR